MIEARATSRTASGLILTPRFPSDSAEMIYATYGPEIFRRTLRFYRGAPSPRESAEDLTADTFLKAYAALPSQEAKLMESGGSLAVRPWLHRIARNLYIDKQRRDMKFVWESIEQTAGTSHASYVSLDNPLADVVAQEERRIVQTVLTKLLPRERVSLLLFENEGLSCEEIAGRMNTTRNAVKKLLSRARRKFRSIYPSEQLE